MLILFNYFNILALFFMEILFASPGYIASMVVIPNDGVVICTFSVFIDQTDIKIRLPSWKLLDSSTLEPATNLEVPPILFANQASSTLFHQEMETRVLSHSILSHKIGGQEKSCTNSENIKYQENNPLLLSRTIPFCSSFVSSSPEISALPSALITML